MNRDIYALTCSVYELTCSVHDYIPLIGIVDVKPTSTNEINVDLPEPIMFMGMKIIGDSKKSDS
jgi:hypothetical protein